MDAERLEPQPSQRQQKQQAFMKEIGQVANSYDVIVIGGGREAYVAAIRASQLGLKTAVVEREAFWGGICLKLGLYPTKRLRSAEVLPLHEHAKDYRLTLVNSHSIWRHSQSDPVAYLASSMRCGFLLQEKNKVDVHLGPELKLPNPVK